MLVWLSLAVAGIGYWWSQQARHSVRQNGETWTEQDAAETAEHVARMLREKTS